MGFDLRKTLGLYNAEREARKALSTLKDLIGIDLGQIAVNSALEKAGLGKADALRIADALIAYGSGK
jgi:uncharacterized membrane protein (DUF2068 family)